MTTRSTYPSHRTQFKAAKLLAALAIAGLAHQGIAAAPAPNTLPTGGQVVAGTAAITSTGNTMNVNQTSQRAVVNWSSFDVGSQATVNFNQPNTAAATLNYVNSATKSMINGAVNANGQVIFVNNNGVVFGKGAEVNVGGMVATTMNTSAADFMSGKDIQVYEGGNSGKVINKGNITGNNINSYIALMAPQVKNTGVITATLGGNNAIALVSGQKVTLKFSGSQFVNVSVDASVVNSLISNKLLINAGGGQVIIAANAAQNLMGSIVRNTGTISASDISTAGGKVTLTADTIDQSGVIEANSAQNAGGKISLRGSNITLASGSRTSATGATAGGDICIGANYTEEQNTQNIINSIKNNDLSDLVTVKSNAVIDTSAIQNGNGGSINIWSKTRTSVAGSLYARGGAQGGNGGFIETSSKGNVDLNQGLIVDTSSSNGKSGTPGRWVIDPTTLIIDSTAANIISNALNTTSVTLDATGSTCSAFGASCIQSQTALIKILAGADIYSSNTATSLSLIATGGQIDIDSNITAGAVYAVAQAINVNGSINTNGGSNSNIYLAGAIINILGNINSNGNTNNNQNSNTNSNSLNTVNTTTANNRRNAINSNNQNTLNADGNTYTTNGGLINILATGDINIGSTSVDSSTNPNAYISANGLNGGTITIVSTAGKVNVNAVIDTLGKAGNAGKIDIVGKDQINLTNALISTEGLGQGGLLNLGQINNLGNGTILAPPATAPPALATYVQNAVTAATLNSNNSITSNSVIIDSQTGINAPNGNIVVFGDQIQVNNSSITATNGTIAIGREGYSSGALSSYANVTSTSLVANKVETSGKTLEVGSNTVLASEWLLDPTNVTIGATAGTPTGTNPIIYTNQATVSAADIVVAINAGTSVTIIADGTITQSSALTFANNTANATLMLDNTAGSMQAITLSAGITATGSSATHIVVKSAGGLIGANGAINVTGDVTIDNTYNVGGTTSGFINEMNGLTYTSLTGGSQSSGVKNTASITAKNITIKGAHAVASQHGVWLAGSLNATNNINITGTNSVNTGSGNSAGIYSNSATAITSTQGVVNIVGKIRLNTAITGTTHTGTYFNNSAAGTNFTITAHQINVTGYASNSVAETTQLSYGISSAGVSYVINSSADYSATGTLGRTAISFYGEVTPVYGSGIGLFTSANAASTNTGFGSINQNASGGDISFVSNNKIRVALNTITVAANNTGIASQILYDSRSAVAGSGAILNYGIVNAGSGGNTPVNFVQKSNGGTISDGTGAISANGYISIDNTNGSTSTATTLDANGVNITGALTSGTLAGTTGVRINSVATGVGVGISVGTGATITQNANGGGVTLTSTAGINILASITEKSATTSDVKIIAGGKINFNNDNTLINRTAASGIGITTATAPMNVTIQSSYANNVDATIFKSNIYLYGNITTKGGFITLDGTGGTIANATGGGAIAGETITPGSIANGGVYIDWGTNLNTVTAGGVPTASSTGGNVNIAASKSVGNSVGSFEQGLNAPIYAGGNVNMNMTSSGNATFNFIVFNRSNTSPITAKGSINVVSNTSQSTINQTNTGAVNITSPWTSLAGEVNINNISTGVGTTGVYNWAAVSGANGINITNSSLGAVGINTSGTGATFTSSSGRVSLTNTSTNVATGTSAGINLTGAVSGATGVSIVNNSESGTTTASGVYFTAAISSSAGNVLINSTTTTGSAIGSTSAGTISALTGVNVVGSSTQASLLNNAYGLVSVLGAIADTGTGGVNVQSTGDTIVGAVTDSGTGGISITGGYNIAAGTVTGGTITGVGVLTNTNGGVISLSMAQPTSATGGAIETAAGITSTNASVGSNVTYSLRGGVMNLAYSGVNNVNYRSPLTPATISLELLQSYVTTYGVSYTDLDPQNWVKNAANSSITISGGGAFGASPSASSVLASLSLNSIGGGSTIAVNRVHGPTTLVTGDILSPYGVVTITTASTAGAGTYTVNPATLTITSKSSSSVYDGVTTFNTLTQAGYSVTGLISTIGGTPTGDAVASTTSNINVGSALGSVVNGATVATAGAYSVIESAAQGSNLGNYTINYVRSTFNVTPAALTITAANDSKTYGSTTTNAGIAYNASGVKTTSADGFTVSGLLGSDAVNTVTLSSLTGAIATANASTTPYAITPSAAAGAGLSNYTINYIDGGLIVNKAVLTITNPTMVYNGTTTFAAGTSGATATVAGVNGQTFTLGGSATMTNPNVLGGSNITSTAGLTFTGTGSSNYELPASIPNVVITPAPLTVTLAPQTKTYDSTTGAVLTAGTATTNGSYTIGGFVGGQGAFITQTAGIYNSVNASTSGLSSVATTVSTTLSPSNWTAKSGTDLSNYSLPTTTSAAGTINKAPLAILANDVSTFVNTQPAAGSLTYVVSGLVGTDTSSVFTVAPAVALASDASLAAPGIFAGKVIPSVTAPNYTVTATPGTLTVLGNNAILVAVGTTSKVYGTYNASQTANIQADIAALGTPIVTVQYKPAVSGVVNFTVARNGSTGVWTATDGITGNSATYTFTVTPTIPTGSYSTANYLRVGSYALVPANLTLASGSTANCVSCSVSYTSGTLTITPAPLLATVTPGAMTYNANTAITSTTVLSGTGVFAGVPSNVSGVTTLTAGSPDAGLQTINNGGTLLSGPDAANFTVTTTVLVPEASGGPTNGVVAPASATTDGSGYSINIAKAPLVYSGVVRSSVYTGNAQTNTGATLTSGTLYSTDNFTIAGYASATNVSQGTVADNLAATATGTTNLDNYAITYNHGSLTITGAPLIITATSDTKTYGSTTTNSGIAYNASGVKVLTADGYTVGGLIGSDVVTSVTLSSSGALAAANVVGSPYAITPSSAAGTGNLGNYTISYVNGTLTVNPAVLTIANATMVYNGTTTFAPGVSGATATFDGVNGQTVTIGGSATMTNANVLGTSAINNTAGLTVTSVSGGVLASNYVLPSTIANVDITPAPLVYTGANNTTVFNNTLQTNSGATLTSGTLFGSDTFAISGYATKTDVSRVGNVATGALTATSDSLVATATGVTNPNNYSITYVQGGLTITPAPLTATVTPSALTYNGATTITSATTLSGFIGGATDVSGTTALTAGSPNAGVQTIINGGTTLTGTDSLNYAVANTVLATTTAGSTNGANGVVAVSPAANGSGYTIDIARLLLTYTGQNTVHAYTGAAISSGTAALTGTPAGSESFTLSGYASATNVAQGKVVDQLVATPATGTLASNYDIRYINGSITITPLQLTVTMTAPNGGSKVYDSTTAAALTAGTASNPGSYAIAGFIAGEGAYITQAAGTYSSPNVAGTGLSTITATLAPSAWVANGSTLLSNYILDTSATAAGTITPAPLSITANNAATFVGVTPSNLTYVVSGLVGTDTPSSAFSVAPTVTLNTAGTTGLATAGTYAGSLIPAVTAPNYTVIPTAGTLTVVGNSILVVSVGTTSQVFGTYNQTQVTNGTISKAAPNVTVGYCTNCSDSAVIANPSLRTIVNLNVTAPSSGTTSGNSLWTASDSISVGTAAQGIYNFTVTPTVSAGSYSTGNYLNVGNYALVPGNVTTVAGQATNYQGTPIYTSGNLNITPLTLAFAPATPTQTYNGLTAFSGLSLAPTNLPSGITGITSVVGSGNFTSPNASTAAGYTINNAVISGADAANFVFAGASGTTGVINKAALEYTGIVRTSVFNGATQINNGATLTSGTIAAGESFTIGGYAQQRNVLATATPDALAATPGANTLASNYQITYNNGSLRITPAPLTATVTAAGLTYNGSNAISSTTVLTGFVGGATGVTGATSLTAAVADAGIQTINNGGTLLSGVEAANYSVTNTVLASTAANGVAPTSTGSAQANGSGYSINIAKAPLTYTGADTTLTYNGTLQTNSPATLTSGSIVSGQGFTISGYATGTTVYEMPIESLVATANNGTNLNNYAITFVNGSLTIKPAPLTISGLTANSKVYDGNTAAVVVGTPTLAGQIVPGDVVTIDSGSVTQGVFASPAVSGRALTGVTANWDDFVLSNLNYYVQGPTQPLAARINPVLTAQNPVPAATPASTPRAAVAQDKSQMVLLAHQNAAEIVIQDAVAEAQPNYLIKGEMLYVRDGDNLGDHFHALPVPSSGAFKFPAPDQLTQELIESSGEHVSVSGTPASFGGHKLLMLPKDSVLTATLEDGSPLPAGIRFNATTRSFSIPKLGDVTLPINVKVAIMRGNKVLSDKTLVVTK